MNKKLVSCLVTVVYSLNSLPVFANPLIPISSGISVLNDFSPRNVGLPFRAAPAFSDERENRLYDAEQLLRQSIQNADRFGWKAKRKTKRDLPRKGTDTCPSTECHLKDDRLYSDNLKETVSGIRLISKEEISSGNNRVTVAGFFFGRNLSPKKFKEFSNVFGSEGEKILFLGKVNSKRETGHTTVLDLLGDVSNCLCFENETLTLTKDLADIMKKRIGQRADRLIGIHQDKLVNSGHMDENAFYGFATLMPKLPSNDALGITSSEFAYYKLSFSEFQRLTFELSENLLAISHAPNKTIKTALLTQKGCLPLATPESEPSTSRIVNTRTKFLRDLFSAENTPLISEERQCPFGNLSHIFPSYSPPFSPRDEENTTELKQSYAETASYVTYLTAGGIILGITGAVAVIGGFVYRWMKNSHKQRRNLTYDAAVYNNH